MKLTVVVRIFWMHPIFLQALWSLFFFALSVHRDCEPLSKIWLLPHRLHWCSTIRRREYECWMASVNSMSCSFFTSHKLADQQALLFVVSVSGVVVHRHLSQTIFSSRFKIFLASFSMTMSLQSCVHCVFRQQLSWRKTLKTQLAACASFPAHLLFHWAP